eukprot:g2535.t1
MSASASLASRQLEEVDQRAYSSLAYHELQQGGPTGRQRLLLEEIANKHFLEHCDEHEHLTYEKVDRCLASLIGTLSYEDTKDALQLCNNDDGFVDWPAFRAFLFSDPTRYDRLVADSTGIAKKFLDLKVSLGLSTPKRRPTFLRALADGPDVFTPGAYDAVEEEGEDKGDGEGGDDDDEEEDEDGGDEHKDGQGSNAAASGTDMEWDFFRSDDADIAATKMALVEDKVQQILGLQDRIRQLQYEVEVHKAEEAQREVYKRLDEERRRSEGQLGFLPQQGRGAGAGAGGRGRASGGGDDANHRNTDASRCGAALRRVCPSSAQRLHVWVLLVAATAVVAVLSAAVVEVNRGLVVGNANMAASAAVDLSEQALAEAAVAVGLIAQGMLRDELQLPEMPRDAPADDVAALNTTASLGRLARLVNETVRSASRDGLISQCSVGTPAGTTVGARWLGPGNVSAFGTTSVAGWGGGCLADYRLFSVPHAQHALAIFAGAVCGGSAYHDPEALEAAVEVLGGNRDASLPPRLSWTASDANEQTLERTTASTLIFHNELLEEVGVVSCELRIDVLNARIGGALRPGPSGTVSQVFAAAISPNATTTRYLSNSTQPPSDTVARDAMESLLPDPSRPRGRQRAADEALASRSAVRLATLKYSAAEYRKVGRDANPHVLAVIAASSTRTDVVQVWVLVVASSVAVGLTLLLLITSGPPSRWRCHAACGRADCRWAKNQYQIRPGTQEFEPVPAPRPTPLGQRASLVLCTAAVLFLLLLWHAAARFVFDAEVGAHGYRLWQASGMVTAGLLEHAEVVGVGMLWGQAAAGSPVDDQLLFDHWQAVRKASPANVSALSCDYGSGLTVSMTGSALPAASGVLAKEQPGLVSEAWMARRTASLNGSAVYLALQPGSQFTEGAHGQPLPRKQPLGNGVGGGSSLGGGGWQLSRQLSLFPTLADCSVVATVKRLAPPRPDLYPPLPVALPSTAAAELPRRAVGERLRRVAAGALRGMAPNASHHYGAAHRVITFIFDAGAAATGGQGDVVATSVDSSSGASLSGTAHTGAAALYFHESCECDVCTLRGGTTATGGSASRSVAAQHVEAAMRAARSMLAASAASTEPRQRRMRLPVNGMPAEYLITAGRLEPPLRERGIDTSGADWVLVTMVDRMHAVAGFREASVLALLVSASVFALYAWFLYYLRRRGRTAGARTGDGSGDGNNREQAGAGAGPGAQEEDEGTKSAGEHFEADGDAFPGHEFDAALFNVLKPMVIKVRRQLEASMATKPNYQGQDYKTRMRRSKVKHSRALEWIIYSHQGYHVQDLLLADVTEDSARKRALLFFGSNLYIVAARAVSIAHCAYAAFETPRVGGAALGAAAEGGADRSHRWQPEWSVIVNLRLLFLLLELADLVLHSFVRGWRDYLPSARKRGGVTWRVRRIVAVRGAIILAMLADMVVQATTGYCSPRPGGVVILFPVTMIGRPLLLILKSESLARMCQSLVQLVRVARDVVLALAGLIVVAAVWATCLVPGDGFTNAVEMVVVLLSPEGRPFWWETAAEYLGLLFCFTIAGFFFIGASVLATVQDIFCRMQQRRLGDAKRTARMGSIAAFIMLDEQEQGALHVNDFHGFRDTGLKFRTCWSHGLDLLYANMGLRPAPPEELNLSEFVELCERLVPVFKPSSVDTASRFWMRRKRRWTCQQHRLVRKAWVRIMIAGRYVGAYTPGVVLLQLSLAAAYASQYVVGSAEAVVVLDCLHATLLVVYFVELVCRSAAVGGPSTFLTYTPPFTTAAQACFNAIDLGICALSLVGIVATRAAALKLPFGALPAQGGAAGAAADASRGFLILPTLRIFTVSASHWRNVYGADLVTGAASCP